jgi:hypothetical protein
VQRGAHERHPDGLAFGEHRREPLRFEALDARPQAHVRVGRLLGLQPDDALERLAEPRRRTAQQELALEQRAVERPRPERRHTSTTTGSTIGRRRSRS